MVEISITTIILNFTTRGAGILGPRAFMPAPTRSQPTETWDLVTR